MQDHYAILGVTRKASADEIKSAFRKLAKEHHPDINKSEGAEKKFKEINEAYSVLSDPKKRAEYDAFGSGTGPRTQGNRYQSAHHQWSRDNWNEYSFDFGNSGSADDLLRQVYESLRRAGYANARWEEKVVRNHSIHASVSVTLESVLKEQKRVVNIATANDNYDVEITIPAGVETGTQIMFKGKGSTKIKDAPPGDLTVTVIVEQHPSFTRSGINLHSEVVIDAFEAMVGKTLQFKTIDGVTANLTLPPGTQSGVKYRLAGRGLIDRFTQIRGDQFVQVAVTIPTDLNQSQIDRIKAIMDERV